MDDKELDEILTNLDVYKLNQGGVMGGVDFSIEEHYAMYPELKKAKAEILALIKQEKQELLNRVEKEVIGEDAEASNDMSDKTYLHIQGGNIIRKELRHRISDMRDKI